MESIAIITARGGSKRIPKKNIRNFCGKPIIAYSIEAARESGVFDEVMVSTDSEDIAKIAKRYGASVPFLRSEATSNDYATTADVLEEVLLRYRKTGKEYDFFACIYPTAPFLTGEKLKRAANVFNNIGADSVVPVVKFAYPPQRAFVMVDNLIRYQYPIYKNERSQDLEPLYHDCGQFYFCKIDAFMRTHCLVTEKTAALIMHEEEVQDIDTMSDWVIAEAKYAALQKEKC